MQEKCGNEHKNEVETRGREKIKLRGNVQKSRRDEARSKERGGRWRKVLSLLLDGLGQSGETGCLEPHWHGALTSGGGGLWRAALSRPWAAPAAFPSSPPHDLRTPVLCPGPLRWRRRRQRDRRLCGRRWRLWWPWCRRKSGWCRRQSGWGRSRRPSAGSRSKRGREEVKYRPFQHFTTITTNSKPKFH